MKHILHLTFIVILMTISSAAGAQHCRYCQNNCSDVVKQTVTVLTYNVGAFRKYMEDSVPMVADIIRESGADIVSLNELDSCNTRCGLNSFPLETLSGDLGGWNWHYSRTIPYAGGAYGIGIACSPELQVLNKYTVPLPKSDGSEPRTLSVMEFENFVFASTHLDYRGENAPMEQAGIITEWCTEKYSGTGKPVILCGDFNCTPDSQVIRYLSDRWDIITPPDTTFPETDICIDYIMILENGSSYTVRESEVCTCSRAGDIYKASDHLPVKAVIIF